MNFDFEKPPDEDSPDLTDEEIATAIPTEDSNAFVRELEANLRQLIRPNVGGSIQSHELRKRKPHLYCRTRLNFPGEPDKLLVFQVDWLGGT